MASAHQRFPSQRPETGERRPSLAVRAIIADPAGRVLVLRRSPGSMAGGRWCLPGGKVEFGETAGCALEKEVREETGLTCDVITFLFYQDSLPVPDAPLHFVSLYFECRVSGEVTLNPESSEFAWMGRGELDRFALAFGHDEGMRRYWGVGQSARDESE